MVASLPCPLPYQPGAGIVVLEAIPTEGTAVTLPKTIKLTFIKTLLINICYLLFHFVLFSHFLGFWRSLPLVGTFNSVGRSMTHIKNKFGIVSAVVTHYGITLAGVVISVYVRSVMHSG
jgi:hypothetical protein